MNFREFIKLREQGSGGAMPGPDQAGQLGTGMAPSKPQLNPVSPTVSPAKLPQLRGVKVNDPKFRPQKLFGRYQINPSPDIFKKINKSTKA